jgi:hypothetical protein
MFGTIPGSVYGWPKNVLHWKGIDRSILDINSTMPLHFVIADGIVAMEGNGPLHGTARALGQNRHVGRSGDGRLHMRAAPPSAARHSCRVILNLE